MGPGVFPQDLQRKKWVTTGSRNPLDHLVELTGFDGVRGSPAVTGAYDAIALIEAPDVNALGTTIVAKVQAESFHRRCTQKHCSGWRRTRRSRAAL